MGVTIQSPNNAVNISYRDFLWLQRTVAGLTSKAVLEMYLDLLLPPIVKEDAFTKECEERYEELWEASTKNVRYVLDFIHNPGESGEISWKQAKAVLTILKKYTGKSEFDYSLSHKDLVIRQFQIVLNDCTVANDELRWEKT